MSGRVDDGLAMIRQGVRIAPFNVEYHVILGYALYNVRRFDESLGEYREARNLDAYRPIASWGLAQTYAFQQRADEAVTETLASLRLMLMPPRVDAAVKKLQAAYRRGGLENFWRSALTVEDEGIRNPEAVWRDPYRHRVVHFHIARSYARVGDRDGAVTSLEAAYGKREGNLVCIGVEPLFDNLRSDARFQDLVRRVGLKP